MIPPKPTSRPRRVPMWRYLKLFRQDILSAQPEHLYTAKMAEFRTPFFRSFFLNTTDLVRRVLVAEAPDFPKSDRVSEGLRPLLGRSVFLTNGPEWARQRRIIDPAFQAARVPNVFPAMLDAAQAAVSRLSSGEKEVEAWAAHGAADVIFRTLFSVPISDKLAHEVFESFQDYQREQPIINLGAFVHLPAWIPRFHSRKTKEAAARIRRGIAAMVDRRSNEISEGNAPDDLATKIMTTKDPDTGAVFGVDEMVDQVAIFFLAGHETSASSLAWAIYLLARDQSAQEQLREEAKSLPALPTLSDITACTFARSVFKETLRLYPPVPMMVREAAREQSFRNRSIRRGAQVIISPWHLHRNPSYWENPDAFVPERPSRTEAFVPFSAGPRVCPGAGFAMIEGPLFLLLLAREFRWTAVGEPPVPVAHLTVRSDKGIFVEFV